MQRHCPTASLTGWARSRHSRPTMTGPEPRRAGNPPRAGPTSDARRTPSSTTARTGAASSAADATGASGSSDSASAPGSSNDTGPAPQIEVPDETDDTGGSAPSGDSGAALARRRRLDWHLLCTFRRPPGLSLTIGGEGTGTGVSAGSSGASVQPGSADVGGGEPPAATAQVTDTEGSSNSVDIGAPATGSLIP